LLFTETIMMPDEYDLPYVFALDPITVSPGITLYRRMPLPEGYYEPVWWRAFASDTERHKYYNWLWAQRDTGIWPVWAAVAIVSGVQALTRQLDAAIWSRAIDEVSAGFRWAKGPSRGLTFEERVRQQRFRLELRMPDLGLPLSTATPPRSNSRCGRSASRQKRRPARSPSG
jgi:hypothetical protein